ncbi:unnamed protein product, partial [Effrenium voratum]
RWCGVKIPLSSPSSLVACWSGALGGFEAVNSTGVAAVWLTVGSPPQVQGTPGPIYRRELPVAPLSGSSWPSYINSGTYNVSVHMYGRSAPGADSPGPVQVSICEMPSRCLAPLDLRELPEGEVSVDTTRTWSGTTLFPRGVLVTSLSTDPYLAEYVDVALHGQWRRFPLNRWLLMQDGHAENLWESYTPPPLPSAAPTDSLYTEGDRCGGCGLGTICRERPQTALELAKQGISLALATTVYMTWDCLFACGDGLVLGEEQCDDGNLEAFDGCDANCQVEPGFVCDGSTGTAPSQCRPNSCGAAPNPTSVPCQAGDEAEVVSCRRTSALDACQSGNAMAPPEMHAGCVSGDQRCEVAAAHPKAVVAMLVQGAMLVAFDTAVAEWNGTSCGTELDCSTLFSPTTVAELGDGASCIQGSLRHWMVRLGFGAALGLEASMAVFVLDTARQYHRLDAAIEVSRPFEYPSQRLFLGPALREAENFEQPRVVLRGPQTWGPCGNVVVDGSLSTGSGGRPWTFARWRCTGDPSHCAEIYPHMPNSCNQLTPLAKAGLAVGSVACGLLLTIPESVVNKLTVSLAVVVVYLKLENAYGHWAEAEHTIRFTVDRLPLAVALTDEEVFVDQGSRIRLELSVGPALPVASQGAGSACGALGPVSLEWRYGLGSIDVGQVWETMATPPPSLLATLAAKTATLEGYLGALDVPGTNWTLAARVFHVAGSSEPVYMPFKIVVRPQPPAIRLQAPVRISDGCGFAVVAETSGVTGDPYITWKCVALDVVELNSQEAATCAARAMQTRQSVLSLPSLVPGVYQIEATLDTEPKPTTTAFVTVETNSGPQVQILEPVVPIVRSGEAEAVRFRVRLQATACGKGALAAAVVVLSAVPGDRGAARPSMVLAASVMNISADLQGDDTFEATVPLSSLALGLSHTFQLLLAEGSEARQAMVQHTAGITAAVPATLEVPTQVWAYYSAPVTRVQPPLARLFVDPAAGFATRTLFKLRARALCAGCVYSFRLAPRRMDLNINISNATVGCPCDWATENWQDLRERSLDPEATLPLMKGNYVLEVRVQSPEGGTAEACTDVDVTDSDFSLDGSETASEVAQLIVTWTSDASKSIATLRAIQRPTLLVQSLESIALEFPAVDTLASSESDPVLRQLYTELCEGAGDAVWGLPESEFVVARRLSTAEPLLTRTLQSVQTSMQAAFPLLTLTELWQTLHVLDTVLERNGQLKGVLGPGSAGKPFLSFPMLALADLVLVKAFYIANSTFSVITRSDCSALVDRVMTTTLGIGDASAATGNFNSVPLEVSNSGRALILSSRSFESFSFISSGLNVDLTTQTIVDRPYPGLTIPPVFGDRYNALVDNVTTLGGPPLCLGQENTLMGRFDLLILQWGFNTLAVGARLGSLAPSGGALISVRDIRIRSCGVDVPLGPAALDGQDIELLWELPEPVIAERRWGYGNISPFRCVRWVSSGIGRPGQWLVEGCTSVYRGKEEAPVGDKEGLAEGVLRCRCSSLIPGTWAVEIVPRPEVFVEPPPVANTSLRTLVAYGVLMLWLPFLVPLIMWALVGDLILNLYGQEATRKLAESLLPAALHYRGVWEEVEAKFTAVPWPLRCAVSLHLAAFRRLICPGRERRQRWRENAKDLLRYRDALCYARLRGSRVVPFEEEKVTEGPVQDPTIRERAPVARWRKGPAALPASPSGPGQVGQAQDLREQKGELKDRRPSQSQPRPEIVKGNQVFEAEHTKAALNLTEQDWSEQVRGQVTGTGVQRALPEGWIAQSAASYGGQVYYVNLINGRSAWEMPTQPAVKVLSMQELRDLLGPAADGVALRRQLEEMLRPRIAERLAAMDAAAGSQ